MGISSIFRSNGFNLAEGFATAILSNVLLLLALISALVARFSERWSCWTPATFTDQMTIYTEFYCGSQPIIFTMNDDYGYSDNTGPRVQETALENYRFALLLFWQAIILRLPYIGWIITKKLAVVDLDSLLALGRAHCYSHEHQRQSVAKSVAELLHTNYSYQKTPSSSTAMRLVRFALQLIPGAVILSVGFIVTSSSYVRASDIVYDQTAKFMKLNDSDVSLDYMWENVANTTHLLKEFYSELTYMCDFEVKVLGNVHRHTVQCYATVSHFSRFVLPYMFLTFGIFTVVTRVALAYDIITVIISWLPGLRQCFLNRHIGALPSAAHPNQPDTRSRLAKKQNCLNMFKFSLSQFQLDGLFILRYLAKRGCDVLVYDVVNHVYNSSDDQTEPQRPLDNRMSNLYPAANAPEVERLTRAEGPPNYSKL